MLDAIVGGVQITAFESLSHCARLILADARSGRGGFAVAINAEKIITSQRDPEVAALIRRASLRYPDGAGAVVAMRCKGARTVRVAGADLWLGILREAGGEPVSVALIGGAPDVLRRTRARLEREFPHVRICVARDGFEGARDTAAVLRDIEAQRPELIFVAMGSPRQECLIEELRRGYGRGFYLGLGGSFDVYCGLKRRAPLWMQRCGLEWLFRFLCEPSRARRETKRLQFLLRLTAGRL